MLEQIKGLYYFFEDRYYEVLDRLNRFVPVYNIVDPIDNVFPSFMAFISFLFLALFLLLAALLGGGDPIAFLFSIGGGVPATFLVTDADDTPLSGVLAEFSGKGRTESRTTDPFGEFQSLLVGESITVSVKHKGFQQFRDTMDIEQGKAYQIKLSKESSGTEIRRISFELRSEDRSLLGSSQDVSMSFSCSGQQVAPLGFSKKGPSHSVSVQTNCGILTAKISAVGFEDALKQVDVRSQEGTVIVGLARKQSFASLRVLVKDRKTGAPVEGVSLRLKIGDATAVQGGTTDATGTRIIPRVPGGTYRVFAEPDEGSGYAVAYSDEFSVGVAQFASNGPLQVEVLLEKPVDPGSIFLKFIDSVSSEQVKDVQAGLVIENSVSHSKSSLSDGTVRFVNLEAGKKYAVIARHEKYVLKVISNAELSKSQAPSLVKLVKASAANSGIARAIVSEHSSAKVQGAEVLLYSKDNTFPVDSARTGSDGKFDFQNLPPGEYKVLASKEIDGTAFSVTSELKAIASGQTTEFSLVLVMASGSIEAEVFDESGKKLEGASVSFYDSVSDSKLDEKNTGANGKTEKVQLRANKIPYLVVKKQGFYDTYTRPYHITASATETVKVSMRPVKEQQVAAPFDVELGAITELSGSQAAKLEENKEYIFRFRFFAVKALSDAKAAVRAGLDSEAANSDTNILIKGFSVFSGPARFFSCYNPENSFAECETKPIDFTASGAKQAIANLGDLLPGVYDFEARVFVKDVPAEKEESAVMEMRYGGKAKADGTNFFRKNEKELYVWRAGLKKPFCLSDCGVLISLSIQDLKKTQFAAPLPLANESLTKLLKSESYTLYYEAANLGQTAFDDVKMSLSNTPLVNNAPVLELPSSPVSVGKLERGQTVKGSFNFSAPSNVESTALALSLGLSKPGDSAKVLFSVSELAAMQMALIPERLLPGVPNTVVVKVVDSKGAPVGKADIFFEESPSGRQIPIGGPTNDAGLYSALFRESLSPGTVIVVKGQKQGYAAAEKRLTVGPETAVQAGDECITVNDSSPDLVVLEIDSRVCTAPMTCSGGKAAQFSIKNNSCGQEMIVRLQKHPDSDLVIEKGQAKYTPGEEFVLANNGSADFKVTSQKQFGLHPIYIEGSRGSGGARLGFGTVKVSVFDPRVCLFAEKPVKEGPKSGEKFSLDFSGESETLRFLNKCFTSLLGESYPSNDLTAGVLKEKLLIDLGESLNDAPNSLSSQAYSVRNIGVTGDTFFLITTEDYVKYPGGG